MRIRDFAEADGWDTTGSNILAPVHMARIEAIFKTSGPILLKHWFYRGGCSPEFHACSDMESLLAYLEEAAAAGDAIDVWAIAEICHMDQCIASGKCPDDQGRVPHGGAY